VLSDNHLLKLRTSYALSHNKQCSAAAHNKVAFNVILASLQTVFICLFAHAANLYAPTRACAASQRSSTMYVYLHCTAAQLWCAAADRTTATATTVPIATVVTAAAAATATAATALLLLLNSTVAAATSATAAVSSQ
jgi:hypothetical protein